MAKNMMRTLALAAIFTTSVFVADGAMPSFVDTPVAEASVDVANYKYTGFATETLELLNAERRAMGVREVKLNPYLTEAARKHAIYLHTNNIVGGSHTQIKGKKNFTGVDVKARALEAGFSGGADLKESIATDSKLTAATHLNGALEAIAHRGSFTSPIVSEIGIYNYNGSIVYVGATSDGYTQEVFDVYPYDGQKDAPTRYYIVEEPNPLAKYGVKSAGYPISFGHTIKGSKLLDSWSVSIRMVLKDSKGAIVPLLNKNSMSDYASAGYYILPKAELKRGEKYTVTAELPMADGSVYKHTWSFTTKGVEQKPVDPTVKYASYVNKHVDFVPTAWWAEDMAWAIDRGLIQGYGSEWNSKTGRYENLLKPNNQLTEAHFITILLRQLDPNDLKTTKATADWRHSGLYNLAKAHGFPTLSNDSTLWYKSLADQPIKRGRVAQILASDYHNQVISEKVAIEFLMSKGVTTSATVADFNAGSVLTRAQVVAFVKRYSELIGE